MAFPLEKMDCNDGMGLCFLSVNVWLVINELPMWLPPSAVQQ